MPTGALREGERAPQLRDGRPVGNLKPHSRLNRVRANCTAHEAPSGASTSRRLDQLPAGSSTQRGDPASSGRHVLTSPWRDLRTGKGSG